MSLSRSPLTPTTGSVPVPRWGSPGVLPADPRYRLTQSARHPAPLSRIPWSARLVGDTWQPYPNTLFTHLRHNWLIVKTWFSVKVSLVTGYRHGARNSCRQIGLTLQCEHLNNKRKQMRIHRSTTMHYAQPSWLPHICSSLQVPYGPGRLWRWHCESMNGAPSLKCFLH